MAGILSIQTEPILGDKEANLAKINAIIEKHTDKKLDLIVLPEFFTTGISETYAAEPEPPTGGRPIEFLSELAKKYNTNIAAGTVVIREEDGLKNALFVIDRQGDTVAKYRKIHLFKYFGGTEDQKITPGITPIVAELDFAKVGLSVCFDIRYPLHYKKLIQMGAEIIVSPTAWGYLKPGGKAEAEKAKGVFESLNVARAVESLVYFVSSDECGGAGFIGLTGSSMITGPDGTVYQNAENKEGAIYANIDLEIVRELKKSYPVAFID